MVNNINDIYANIFEHFHKIKTNSLSSILNVSISNHFLDKIKEVNSIFGQTQIENILNIINYTMDDKNDKQDQLKKSHLSKCVKWCKRNNLPINDIYV